MDNIIKFLTLELQKVVENENGTLTGGYSVVPDKKYLGKSVASNRGGLSATINRKTCNNELQCDPITNKGDYCTNAGKCEPDEPVIIFV